MDGYIKLHRQILEWDWYNDPNTFRLFLHLLLKANHKDASWKGNLIKRGQRFTSINSLSEELKMSIKEIRTAEKKLINTSEIKVLGANNGTMITICKYDYYQSSEETAGQAMGQAKGKKGTSKGQQTRIIRKKQREEDLLEEKDTYIPSQDFIKFQNWMKNYTPTVLKMKTQMTEENLSTLKLKYDSTLIAEKLTEMENKADLLKRYSSVYLTLRNWLKQKA
jgi:hypothetical protein